MKNKKIISLIAVTTMVCSFMLPSLASSADPFNVMSIGANLNATQKQEMINYFNAKEGSYKTLTITNQEEQKDLKGVIPESEIGTKTISCAYVQPTNEGGINVKTANLTYVNASMISNALTTAGIYNANVIAAAPFKVSGTGALTGIINAFEKSSGQSISQEKKDLANKELELTSNIAENKNVGQTKASAVVNGVKSKVIENNIKNNSKIAETINNEAKEYGITLTPAQTKDLTNLMLQISNQKYNKDEMENSLDKIKESLNATLNQKGQLNGGMAKALVNVDSFINWFKNLFGDSQVKEAGIVNNTNNNSKIGKTAITTGSSSAVVGTKAEEPTQVKNEQTSNKIAPNKVETTPNKEVPTNQVKASNYKEGNSQLSTENLRKLEKNMASNTVAFLHNANAVVPEGLEGKLYDYLKENATVESLSKIANMPLTNENIKYVQIDAIVTMNGGYQTGYVIDMSQFGKVFNNNNAQIELKVILPGKPVTKPIIKPVDGKITGKEFTEEVWYAVYKFVKDNPNTAHQYQTDQNLMDAIKQELPMKDDVLAVYNAPFPANLKISCAYSDSIGRKLLFIPTTQFLPMAQLPPSSNNIVVYVTKADGTAFEPFQVG